MVDRRDEHSINRFYKPADVIKWFTGAVNIVKRLTGALNIV